MRNVIRFIAFALGPLLPSGQALSEGEKLYARQCAGCHGADAHGTDRGPGLAANRRVRSRSVRQLRDFIRKGAPGSGMPAFDLPAAELDALAPCYARSTRRLRKAFHTARLRPGSSSSSERDNAPPVIWCTAGERPSVRICRI